MGLTHAPSTHPLTDGTIAVCCQDAWWCDDCAQFRHLADDLYGIGYRICWPCHRTRDAEAARAAASCNALHDLNTP